MSSSLGFVDKTAAAVEFCESCETQYPVDAPVYQTIANYLQHKLWHELSTTLLEFFSKNTNSQQLADLYNTVVLLVQKHLDPLSCAQLTVQTAAALYGTDPSSSKSIMENAMHASSTNTSNTNAKIYLQSKFYTLTLKDDPQTLSEIPQVLKDQAPLLLQQQPPIHTITHVAHYELSMAYYKVVGPPQQFYHAALQYLEHSSSSENALTPQLATDLILSGLSGDGVYNLTALLQVLSNNNKNNETMMVEPWLYQLLETVATGDLDAYQTIVSQHGPTIASAHPTLHRDLSSVILEKVHFNKLLSILWTKDSNQRTCTFSELQAALQVEDVEAILMRAFSKQLLSGRIDQTTERVQIHFVQPQSSLTESQCVQLAHQFGHWSQIVHDTHGTLSTHSTALLA